VVTTLREYVINRYVYSRDARRENLLNNFSFSMRQCSLWGYSGENFNSIVTKARETIHEKNLFVISYC